MCKYCNKLKELINEDRETIERWKNYCQREERLLADAVLHLILQHGLLLSLGHLDYKVMDLVNRIKEELRKDTIR